MPYRRPFAPALLAAGVIIALVLTILRACHACPHRQQSQVFPPHHAAVQR